jgi:hypothetical protein
MAAIYARVSSEQQREENTIASQTASLIEFAKNRELELPQEWVFEDEGGRPSARLQVRTRCRGSACLDSQSQQFKADLPTRRRRP